MLRLSSASSSLAGRASAPAVAAAAAAAAAAPLLRARLAAAVSAAVAVDHAPFRPAAKRQIAAVSPSSSSSSSAAAATSSSSSFSSSFDSSTPSLPSSPPSSPSPPPRFKIHGIAGDGSCLFRALAQGAHYLDATSSSSSSSSPKGPAAGAETPPTTKGSNGGGGFSSSSAPTPLLLEGPDLLAAGFAARRKICAALARNRETIEPFLETPFHAYLDAMSTEGTWGGEPELSVAPEALGRPVCVYSRARDVAGGGGRSGKSSSNDFASLFFGDDIVKVSEYGVEDFSEIAPICLLFGGLHYDLLIVEG